MGGIQFKTVAVRTFGWQRVARNFCRFGWELGDANTITEVRERTRYEGRTYGDTFTVTPHTTRRTKTRVHLSFARDTSAFPDYPRIIALELLFNILFLLRRIIGALLPWGLGITFLCLILNVTETNDPTLPLLVFAAFLVWVLLQFFEYFLSRVAQRILFGT